MFRVSTETIARWEMEATGADGEVVRPLVATDPPVRRFADVVMSLSAWEAYVEELVKESVTSFKPAVPTNTLWQSINADARSKIGRFHTPSTDNVRTLIADTIGLQDVTMSWHWQHMTVQQAKDRLGVALTYRHHIAHGVNPRPTIHNSCASRLPAFFKTLGRCTDRAVRDYLVTALYVPNPWPQ
jgi:hypothetical protein